MVQMHRGSILLGYFPIHGAGIVLPDAFCHLQSLYADCALAKDNGDLVAHLDIVGRLDRPAIARSILAKPKLIIADEPTGNLDKQTGDEALSLLTGCAAKFSQTLIMVTHNPKIADRTDRIIRIADGVICS